jgi:hypothetical protein
MLKRYVAPIEEKRNAYKGLVGNPVKLVAYTSCFRAVAVSVIICS